MKKLLTIIPLVILICFTFGCQRGEEVAEEAEPVIEIEADIEAIKSMEEVTMRAFNEGDLESYMALFDDDTVWMPPNDSTIIGREAIGKLFNFDMFAYDITISVDEVQVLGDWAFIRDTWKGTWTNKESRETTKFDNKSLIILKRQSDGSWKYSHVIWNYNTPPISVK